MTPEQYERWKDFAERAAKTWYAKSRRPSAAWVLDTVQEFFDRLDEDTIPCIVNWDNSTEYPEGNPSRRREYYATYCGCDGWRHEHKEPNPECPECRGSGVHHAWESPYGVGDMMTDFLDEPRGYAPLCRVCREYEYEGECSCEEIEDHYYKQWDDQWGSPVHCCIRAGLDLACAPSAGVIGFTAGDIRKMYPEGVPDWIAKPGEKWITEHLAPCSIGFVRTAEPEENGTFTEMPDEVGVWL